ncbi:MAG: choice-of-anchor M domain-containing protein [Verrucomicrobiales bacterium]
MRELLFIWLLPACQLSAGPLLTTQHVDISLANGSNLEARWYNSDANAFYPVTAAKGYVDPVAGVALRPASSSWDFIGVAAGEPFYRLPAGQNPKLLYLGFGAEHATLNAFQTWNPGDPARNVNTSQKWLQVRLNGWRGPGQFSVYTVVSGVPRVWMASSDGVAPSNTSDSLYILEGGHTHYNFAFTARGDYEIDIGIHARQGGQEVSTTATLKFTTEQTLEINTLPTSEVELKWPSLSLGFNLQQSNTLQPGSWTPVVLPPVDDGEFKRVVLPLSPPTRFFRLAKP